MSELSVPIPQISVPIPQPGAAYLRTPPGQQPTHEDVIDAANRFMNDRVAAGRQPYNVDEMTQTYNEFHRQFGSGTGAIATHSGAGPGIQEMIHEGEGAWTKASVGAVTGLSELPQGIYGATDPDLAQGFRTLVQQNVGTPDESRAATVGHVVGGAAGLVATGPAAIPAAAISGYGNQNLAAADQGQDPFTLANQARAAGIGATDAIATAVAGKVPLPGVGKGLVGKLAAPILRGGIRSGEGATIGAVQQVVHNAITGAPLTKGVGDAAGQMAAFSALSGGFHDVVGGIPAKPDQDKIAAALLQAQGKPVPKALQDKIAIKEAQRVADSAPPVDEKAQKDTQKQQDQAFKDAADQAQKQRDQHQAAEDARHEEAVAKAEQDAKIAVEQQKAQEEAQKAAQTPVEAPAEVKPTENPVQPPATSETPTESPVTPTDVDRQDQDQNAVSEPETPPVVYKTATTEPPALNVPIPQTTESLLNKVRSGELTRADLGKMAGKTSIVGVSTPDLAAAAVKTKIKNIGKPNPKAREAAQEALRNSATSRLLDIAKEQGHLASDDELGGDASQLSIHPDTAKQAFPEHFKRSESGEQVLKANSPLRAFVSKDRSSNQAEGQSAQQVDRAEQASVERIRTALSSRAEQVDSISRAFADHPDPNMRMLLAQAQAENQFGRPAQPMETAKAAAARAQVDKDQTEMFPPGENEVLGWGVSPKKILNAAKNAVPPKVMEAASGFSEAGKWLRDTFAPQTAGNQARTMADMLRSAMGRTARNIEVARESLAKAHWYFDGQPPADQEAFIDRFQAGQKQPTPELQMMADTWKKINDSQIKRMDALDPTMKRQWEEDHIKQVWKEKEATVEKALGSIASKRPLEGSKGFLKQKTYATYAEGRAAGLTPLYTNPVDAMMHGFMEAERFINMREVANQVIHSGTGRYTAVGSKPEPGYKFTGDPAFKVYAPPTMSVNEYVNKSVHDALQKTADRMGVNVRTLASTPRIRGAMGYSVQGGNEVVRRMNTDLSVLSHEIGHQLDYKYKLGNMFRDQTELRALADLHNPVDPNTGVIDTRKQAYFRTGVEKSAALLEAYITAPETFKKVAPNSYHGFESFLASHPETQHLVDLERSLALQKITTEIPRQGITQMGEYAVPEQMAQVVANHLGKGLRNNPIFRTYMTASNLMNSIQLAGAFHAGFTSMDSAISRGSLAIEQIANGRPIKGAMSALSSPAAPFTNAYFGHQLISEYLKPGSNPGLSPVVKALVDGGARISQDSAYQNKTISGMVRAFRQGNFLEGTARIPGAMMDAVSYPLMQKLVPMQKWGVMGDLMQEELSKLGPTATKAQINDAARRVVDTTDNRMGQVVYDNLFLNRTAKDLLMAGMRSVGWNMGTMKEVAGGFTSAPRNLFNVAKGKGFATHNTPYVMSMLAITAAMGALYGYLKTGQYPQTLQDYYQPKTGRKDDKGSDIRVQLPTYMRDVMSAMHGVQDDPTKLPGNIIDMAANKAAPLPAALIELAQNRDYWGKQITPPAAPLSKKVADRAKFLASQAKPFSIDNWRKQGAAPADERIGGLLGLTTVPKRDSK